MKKIQEKQNTPKILDLLFSARFYMNQAAKMTNFKYLLILAIVIFTVLLSLKISLNENIINILENSILLLSIAMLFSSQYINDNIRIGALTKQYIDYELYGFDTANLTDSELVIESKNSAINKKIKFYKEQIENTGNSELRGVKDWYFINSSLEGADAILSCQNQNIYWDKNLIKNYKIFIWILIVIIFLLFVIPLFLSKDFSFKLFLSLLIYEFDFFTILKNINTQEKLVIKIQTKIECIAKSFNKEKKKELLEIQNLIYERRKSIVIPDWFHKLASYKIHKNVEDIFS